jgi:membrane protease YdiL (CAAX protease family)
MQVSDYVLPDLIFGNLLAQRFALSVALYYWGALAQQVLMNGYFVNRLSYGLSHRTQVTFLTGILFSLVHLPNPVLTPMTFLGGMLSAYFFQRNKNVYLLALFHTILAVTIKYFLPHAWHHNLRVGPGFFGCCS